MFFNTTILISNEINLLVCNHCVTQWHKQHCPYPYPQQQIGQSDCDITANCDKNCIPLLSPIPHPSINCFTPPFLITIRNALLFFHIFLIFTLFLVPLRRNPSLTVRLMKQHMPVYEKESLFINQEIIFQWRGWVKTEFKLTL